MLCATILLVAVTGLVALCFSTLIQKNNVFEAFFEKGHSPSIEGRVTLHRIKEPALAHLLVGGRAVDYTTPNIQMKIPWILPELLRGSAGLIKRMLLMGENCYSSWPCFPNQISGVDLRPAIFLLFFHQHIPPIYALSLRNGVFVVNHVDIRGGKVSKILDCDFILKIQRSDCWKRPPLWNFIPIELRNFSRNCEPWAILNFQSISGYGDRIFCGFGRFSTSVGRCYGSICLPSGLVPLVVGKQNCKDKKDQSETRYQDTGYRGNSDYLSGPTSIFGEYEDRPLWSLFVAILIYASCAFYGLRMVKAGCRVYNEDIFGLVEIVAGVALVLIGLAFPVHAFLYLLHLWGIW